MARVHVLMFGGSGVTATEYAARKSTVVPVFDADLAKLEGEKLSFAFTYVTAPYDVRYNAFLEHADDCQRWNQHVQQELLPACSSLPVYLVGYSGGAALALNGLHQLANCVGVGTLGGDDIPSDLEENMSWRHPAALYYNRGDDLVLARNEHAIDELVGAGVAKMFRKLGGGHDLADYIRNESLGGLIRRAVKLAG